MKQMTIQQNDDAKQAKPDLIKMFNCSSQPCQYATCLPCIIISVIVGCLQNHDAL